jgi:hypothetical protein
MVKGKLSIYNSQANPTGLHMAYIAYSVRRTAYVIAYRSVHDSSFWRMARDVIVVIVSAKKFGQKKSPLAGAWPVDRLGLGRGALDHFAFGRFVDRIT